jgi:hypothetical protein
MSTADSKATWRVRIAQGVSGGERRTAIGLFPRRTRDEVDDLDAPFLSLLVNVADLAALAGGSLSAVFAVGYGVSGAESGYGVPTRPSRSGWSS